MTRRAVPGSAGWYYGPDGVIKKVRDKKTGQLEEIPVLTWYPEVKDAVAYRTQDGKVTARAFKIRVGTQEEICSESDITRGRAWGRFLKADGFGSRQVGEVLTNIVMHQASKIDHQPGRPYFDDGRLRMPTAEYLPDGYTWGTGHGHEPLRALVAELTKHPTAALMLALSAVAPWVHALKLQPFTLHVEGGTTCGKSTALIACSALWGVGYRGVTTAWGGTALGQLGSLRDLGCLPAFRDELGTWGRPAAERAMLFSQIMEGAQRTARTRDDLARPSTSWAAILFSTGNISAVPAHVASAGTAKGVLELHGDRDEPIIPEDRADIVRKLTNDPDLAGAWVPYAQTLTVDRVQELYDRAGEQLPRPDAGGVEWHMWRHMALAVTGASLLAELTGHHLLVASVVSRALRVMDETQDRVAELGGDQADKLYDALIEFQQVRPEAFGMGDRRADQIGFTVSHRSGETLLCVYPTRLAEIVKAAGVEDWQSALRILRNQGRLISTRGKGFRYAVKRDGRYVYTYAFVETGGNHGNDGNRAGQSDDGGCHPSNGGGNHPAPPTTPVSDETPGQTAIELVATPVATPPAAPVAIPQVATADEVATIAPPELQRDGSGLLIEFPPQPCTRCSRPTRLRDIAGHPRHLGDACEPVSRETTRPRPARGAEELSTFAAAVAKRYPQVTPDDPHLWTALALWHDLTDNLYFLDSAGRTGYRLLRQLERRHGSIPELGALGTDGLPMDFNVFSPFKINWLDASTWQESGHYGTELYHADVNAQYLAVAESVELGNPVSPVHAKRDSRDESAGIMKRPGYLCSTASQPGPVPGVTIEEGQWVPIPLAKVMAQRGRPLIWDQSLTWPQGHHRRWLRVWAARLKAARAQLDGRQDPPSLYAAAALKEVYAAFLGGHLASRQGAAETYRKDWRDMIVSTAKANMLRALYQTTPAPIGAMVDAAWWILPEGAHPVGLKLSRKPGHWKHVESVPIDDELRQIIALGRPATLQKNLAKRRKIG